jgi:hypothetical protein
MDTKDTLLGKMYERLDTYKPKSGEPDYSGLAQTALAPFTNADALMADVFSVSFSMQKQADGSYALVERYYAMDKVYSTKDKYDVIKGNNPFDEQKPFVRILPLNTSVGSDSVLLMEFDESKDLKSQTLKKTLPSLDMTNRRALKVKVFGTGSSTDAICISIQFAGTTTGISQYLIPLNFEGWREIYLCELDNGLYRNYNYTSGFGTYTLYQYTPTYSGSPTVTVTAVGACTNAKLGNIYVCAIISAGVKNPTVTLNGKSITFNCTVPAYSYLEYTPGDKVAYVYDLIGTPTEVSFTGEMPTFGKGDFAATVTGECTENATARMRVTFGFTGKELKD